MAQLGTAKVGQPYLPIPSGEITEEFAAGRHSLVRPIELKFRDRHGITDELKTDRSYVAFARLREAARNREEVAHFSIAGQDADWESVAALNCYLRTARALGRMKLPFDRLRPTENHRFTWAEFCGYLGLNFL